VIFPTIEFAAFFLVVMALSWSLMPVPRYWKPFILLASYAFYGYTDARFVLLIITSTLLNQAAAVAIARRHDRRILIAAVVADLGLLGWFKYYGFFALSVDRMLTGIGLPASLPLLQVALPIGISFFTFQALSYVIDVWRGEIRPARLVDFAVYEAFFPHLVAGPIVRASEFLPQLAGPRDPRAVPVTRAVFLIAGGLVKKVVLADLIATRLVDPVFDTPGQRSSVEVLVAIYGYAVQIYCDFSAYSDIAIGVALLLGFRFPDNFDRPYSATSLREFWRRWHMSLSRWLRDYVYVPLGGNRRGRRRTEVNLLMTMVLGGLWHGAAWTFVCWGLLHGLGLAAERAFEEARRRRPRRGGWPTRYAAPTWAPSTGRSGTALPGSGGDLVIPAPRRPAEGATSISRTGTGAGTGPDAGYGPRLDAGTRADEAVGGTDAGADAGAGGATTAIARTDPAPREVPEVTPGTALAFVPGPRQEPAAGTESRAEPTLRGQWLRRLAAFHVVCLAWVLFRAPDLTTAGVILRRLGTGGFGTGLVTPTVLAAVAVGLGLSAVPGRWWAGAQGVFARLTLPVQVLGLAAFLLLLYSIIGQQDVAPFIYFRF
jgi:D-alanyl-lipoteichoic acid acyltransferase DltB (MBOAT superfamily)